MNVSVLIYYFMCKDLSDTLYNGQTVTQYRTKCFSFTRLFLSLLFLELADAQLLLKYRCSNFYFGRATRVESLFKFLVNVTIYSSMKSASAEKNLIISKTATNCQGWTFRLKHFHFIEYCAKMVHPGKRKRGTCQYILTWSGYPHLVAEFRGVRGVDPGSGAGVEGSGAVVLWATHVWAVGA